MLFGAIFRCLDSALTIAACLSYRSPFVSSFDKREEAKKKKMEFAARHSDHLTVLRAYQVNTMRAARFFVAVTFPTQSRKWLRDVADVAFYFVFYAANMAPLRSRSTVARLFVFKPKIPIWVNFGGSCKGNIVIFY
jgi:hypothetical protein